MSLPYSYTMNQFIKKFSFFKLCLCPPFKLCAVFEWFFWLEKLACLWYWTLSLTRLESVMLQNLLIMLFAVPQFSAYSVHFTPSRYALCIMLTSCTHNCTLYIKMIMIGIKYKLQEQLQHKSFIKMYQIDVSASIWSSFNSYLTVMSIYLHTSPAINNIQIICQSYKLTI